MKAISFAFFLSVCVTLAGCSGLSTFQGSKDSFSCPLPNDVHCTSLTENYERESKLLDRDGTTDRVAAHAPSVPADAVPAPVAPQLAPESAQPPYENESEEWWARYEQKAAYEREHPSALHSDPRTTRRRGESIAYLLLLPRVDEEGDLHLQKEIWLRLEDPAWEIDRLRSDFLQSLSMEM